MASLGLLKISHLNLKAWINPGHAVLFCQRMEETKEIRQHLCADSAADSSSVNKAVVLALRNHQCSKEVAMSFPSGISDDVTNGGFLRLHL